MGTKNNLKATIEGTNQRLKWADNINESPSWWNQWAEQHIAKKQLERARQYAHVPILNLGLLKSIILLAILAAILFFGEKF